MPSPNDLQFTDQNFQSEVINSNLPVLVEFSATWSEPCKVMVPILDRIADDYLGKVKVGRLDIDVAPDIAQRYGVSSVPTFVVFNGGEKTGMLVGLRDREELLKLLGI